MFDWVLNAVLHNYFGNFQLFGNFDCDNPNLKRFNVRNNEY